MDEQDLLGAVERQFVGLASATSVRAGAGVKLGCDHTHYPAHVSLAPETLASLAGDLRL